MSTPNRDLLSLPKLKPVIKERWLTALRGGDYPQTTNTLRDGTGYCCLGVLCDVLKQDIRVDWEVYEEDGLIDAEYTFMGAEDDLPGPVIQYAFSDGDQDRIDRAEVSTTPLIRRNDGEPSQNIQKHSFAQIADIIERYM